jgi:hypothetical protein
MKDYIVFQNNCLIVEVKLDRLFYKVWFIFFESAYKKQNKKENPGQKPDRG